ncbi:hypothetical protein [Micromonospora cathayae]|uniref:Heavy-metal-associated domain-containing protein n=1 Tax=Micromonospora cathayae TaxID=3028804 RepID=A0ABY7ZVS8_9ACTN|nr:hypothetical protein [Micromonospora sp. HUAS 3]WDZ86501.1 hypothetical protein PVK37_08940 [Micromonospora sp. HUAS 3]
MNTGTKLGGFALALGAVFSTAYGAGQLAGPGTPTSGSSHESSDGTSHGDTDTRPGDTNHGSTDDSDHGDGDGHGGTTQAPAGDHLPGGLLVSDRGYTFTPVDAPAGEFAFRITGPDGHPVTAFDEAHDKRMHLIVARRDLSGFRHVHPELGADGTWRVASPLGAPGSWRAFADFTPTGGEPLTLGVDVAVPGSFTPRTLPAPAATATVDGYTVTLDGTLEPGATSAVTLTVSRDGVPVTDLQPYLGAYGHLVALRQGDLAYLHVHPDGVPGDGRTRPGPEVAFRAEVPSAGTYRLYLDFQHGGVVRTAEFTLVAGAADHPHD